MGGSAQRGKEVAGSPVNGNVVESPLSAEDKLTSGSSRPKMMACSPSLGDKVITGSPVTGEVVGGRNTSSPRFKGCSSPPGKITTGSPSLPEKVMTGSSVTGEVGVGSSYSLAEFYEAIADDVRIGPTHICLYVALLNEWDIACANDAIVPVRNVLMKKDAIPLERNAIMKKDSIPLDRNLLMKNARISRRTYHKCMRELHEYGYIRYEPSSNPCLRSRVYLRRL